MMGIDKDIIPDEWDLKTLGDIADVSSGGSAPQGDKYFDGKSPFVRVQHIDQDSDSINRYDLITDEAVKKYKLKKYKSGTIVFPKSGASIYLEKRAMLPVDAYIVSHLCAVNSAQEDVDQEFLFYGLKQIPLSKEKADGYPTLNLSEVKRVSIPLPSFLEQKKVVRVLSVIKKAIEQQEQIIAKTKELKRSLMHRLFTYGLRGEELKETEIGLMPESWVVKRIEDIVEKTSQKNMRKKPDVQFKYIDVSSISNDSFKITGSTTYKGSEAPSRARKIVRTNDILFATVRPTLKRIAYVGNEFDGEICSTAFCVLRGTPTLSSRYLYYYVQRDSFIESLGKFQRGANYPAVTDGNVKDQLIPFPTIEEQKDIADVLLGIDSKINQETRKMDMLKGLFKSMLQLLMTGQVRVKDIDFGEINV